MTTTYKIKAYSRAWGDDDKMTRFEYDGSFQASEDDIKLAFEMKDRETLEGWAETMDCFFDVLFIRVDTDDTVSFNRYEK